MTSPGLSTEALAEIRERAEVARKYAEYHGIKTWTEHIFALLRDQEALLAELDRLRPQEVTTVEELDALPTATVILDRVGQAHQRAMDGSWYLAAGDDDGHDADEYLKALPARVLWRGGES